MDIHKFTRHHRTALRISNATLLVGALALAGGFPAAPAAQSPSPPAAPADLVLRGGKVITLDASDRVAQAIAVRANRIVAVGPDGKVMPPCGRCRELIFQVDESNMDTLVVVGESEVVKLAALLPNR